MTSNAVRAAILVRALRAGLNRDEDAIRECCTDDIRAWTPRLSTQSLDELLEQLQLGPESFSDLELDVAPLDVGGDYACAEWSVAMTHTETGAPVLIHGVTVAEFDGERICSFRQYWDEAALAEQLDIAP
jgi:ketosteroid isomerase-like protein